MASRYRALLIGNSTYPADEHNLQTLKGPVKDIAALNRALIDPGSGLFADVDVTLLPEATSPRAIRALGRFFGTAARDDVLLVYFSGHGKLDQAGRLHLCMQDTESTDLLSTAVSSARIKEFADASRARNVIIVLDCCYAGAFRGADLGDAVAGPGRYVLTSCRGTQLANDATVENGTSFFTQHLVDGLVQAAADQDGDGYVTFSDLYAYVDRRLREAGKQIPQRRVDGDGDVRLAKRPQPVPAQTTAAPPLARHTETIHPSQPQEQPGPGSPPGSSLADNGATVQDTTPAPPGPRTGRARRGVIVAAGAAAIAIAGGAVAAVVLLSGGSGGNSGSTTGTAGISSGSYVASGPWRLRVDDRISGQDNGCTVRLTDTHSGSPIRLPKTPSGTYMFQIHRAGSFRWQVNPSECVVAPVPGPGSDKLPLSWDQPGDSDAFTAPARVAVHVTDSSTGCTITLSDPANGQAINFEHAQQGKANNTVEINAGGHPTAYLSDLTCAVRVSPAP